MPVCPRCRMEYKHGIERCSDCDVALVNALPERGTETAEAQELVELAIFSTVSEAEMVRELLERNDIQTVLRGETDPIGAASGAAPVTILVERKRLSEAREVYQAFFAGEANEIHNQRTEEY